MCHICVWFFGRAVMFWIITASFSPDAQLWENYFAPQHSELLFWREDALLVSNCTSNRNDTFIVQKKTLRPANLLHGKPDSHAMCCMREMRTPPTPLWKQHHMCFQGQKAKCQKLEFWGVFHRTRHQLCCVSPEPNTFHVEYWSVERVMHTKRKQLCHSNRSHFLSRDFFITCARPSTYLRFTY